MESSLPDPDGILGTSPYADPREVEHPLTPFANLDVRILAWVQPRLMHPAYELWGGEAVAATLRFRNLRLREALGASTDGVWEIREAGRNEVLFTVNTPGGRVAEFRSGTLSEGALLVGGKHAFGWLRKSIWEQDFAFVNERGEEIMHFHPETHRSGRSVVAIKEKMLHDPNVALLAVIGKYLALGASTGASSKDPEAHGA